MDTTRFKAYIEATSDTYFKSPIMLRGKKFGKLLDDSETGVLADSSARADTFAATSPTATADAGRPPSAWKLPQALALPSLRAQQVPTSGDSAMDMSQPLSSSSPSSAATADTDLDPQAVALAASSEQVSPCESWDIFEPRLDDSLAADADLATALHMSRNGPELAPLKRLTGNQLLAILARGMPMRKKWLTDASAEAAAASKTSRHMRCLVADGIAYLRYHHQGLNGLMNKAEVSAVLARLEAPSGPWSRAKNLLVYTSNGLLALEAPDATAYAIWVCGLNTAFAAIQPKRARTLLSGPALSVPRQQQLTIVA
ncbi:hypothetical protein WJX72_007749 [[Myrmecia] bisecta]|uniref:PH domain-containing protein n=1 Tax=[Myrmecia] bisecta TaxID=41462 RepID=A0AAW1R7I5_9CHLO